MPTVLRRDGFDFIIYADDHEPMHTHVFKAGTEAVINLGDDTTRPVTMPYVREVKKMKKREARKALRIAWDEQSYLIKKWREIHG